MSNQNINREAKALESRAISLSEQGQIKESIRIFQKAIELEPEDGVLRFNLALTHMKNSDLDAAIQELRESIKFKPDYADSYFAMATCYYGKGVPPRAALYYLAYLDFENSNEKARTSKARLNEFGKEGAQFPIKLYLDFARTELERRVSEIVKNLAGQYGGNMTPEIEANLRPMTSRKLEEHWSAPHFVIASDLLEQDNCRASIAHFIEGLLHAPDRQVALCSLAAAYADEGDFDQAETVLSLVDVNKADADEKQVVEEQIRHLKKFIKSHK